MSVDDQVQADLREEISKGGGKATLMQKYSDRQSELLKVYGGNRSDIPMESEHEFHKIQLKIVHLGRLR